MPTVSFKTLESAPIELMHLMMEPGDEEVRRRDLEIDFVRGLLERSTGEDLVMPVKSLRTLLDAPSYGAIHAKQIAKGKRGHIAGCLLACVYLCHKFHGHHPYFRPSLNRAIHVCITQATSPGGEYGDGSPMPISKQSVLNAWNEYASVAHFWAAMNMGPLGYEFAPQEQILGAYFGRYLGVCEELYRFGVTFVAEHDRSGKPLLDAASAFALPSGVEPVELTSQRVPELLKKMLQTYRAKPLTSKK